MFIDSAEHQNPTAGIDQVQSQVEAVGTWEPQGALLRITHGSRA